MSDELRTLVSKELRERELQTISQVKLTEIQSSLADFLSRCMEKYKDECEFIKRELEELTHTILLSRLNKVLTQNTMNKSFDSNILLRIKSILTNYYEGMICLKSAPDTASRVLVKVLKLFTYKNILLRPGDIVLMDSADAFIYEVLGHVMIYRIKYLNSSSQPNVEKGK